jgi:hypothetical protein
MTSEARQERSLEDMTDRELLLRGARVLDHLDVMIHEVHGWAQQAAPLLERFGGFKAAIGKGFGHGRRG